ncbi:MAG TPA: hypothetical protein PLL69_12745, partial [Gemmatimonadales bacterium]|nr:hypothetical protein [Gemmatimonadales bacterium]
LLPIPAVAQFRADLMAHGILAVRRADPAPGGGSDAEAYLTQPMVSATSRLPFGLNGIATLNFESLTLGRGELSPGAWGEGYVDRRHPHTTVHELLVGTGNLLGAGQDLPRIGLVAGKGFVPFGTDDPMSRPFLSYPVNHHLAQILERAVGIAQLQFGAVTFEGSLFNGDEPERPGQWPLIRHEGKWRFGDSWSARLLFEPVDGRLELQGSLASVHSPEHRRGAGGDQDKLSLSGRWQDPRHYAMLEWARTSELDGFFVFRSMLAETEIRRGRWSVGYRFEHTERPEEERLLDQYRSLRPHLENSILGTFRWSLHTVRLGADLPVRNGRIRFEPFVEVTLGGISRVGQGVADPIGSYGTDRVRHLAAGVVIGWNSFDHRMGRYGVL